jgi:hypothetical protein
VAARSFATSSFLQIQASLDYLISKNIFKSVGVELSDVAELPDSLIKIQGVSCL